MQTIGEKHNSILFAFDSQDQVEAVIPHSLLNQDFFEIKTIARFIRDPIKSWATQRVFLDEVEIQLSKDEKNDPSLMSLRLCANELNGYKSTECIVLNVK